VYLGAHRKYPEEFTVVCRVEKLSVNSVLVTQVIPDFFKFRKKYLLLMTGGGYAVVMIRPSTD